MKFDKSLEVENASIEVISALRKLLPERSINCPLGLHEPYFKDTNAIKYVNECIESGWVSTAGLWVNKFEKKVCDITGAKNAVAVTNGTVALRLALHIEGVKANDEVLVPPLSFVATANAISHLGAFPHFIDIDKETLALSPTSLKKHLEKVAQKKVNGVFNRFTGKRIAAIVVVHVFGIPANMPKIMEVANDWGLKVVEDAAEALCSFRENIHCGLFGSIGTISFNGNKLVTTGGGGCLITNDDQKSKIAKHLSTTAKINHPWDFKHDAIAWNDRMPNINAALGFSQLECVLKRVKKKQLLYKKYSKILNNISFCELIKIPEKCKVNYWLIAIKIQHSNSELNQYIVNSILEKAFKMGWSLRPIWEPLNKLKMYENNQSSSLKICEEEFNKVICLPSSPQIIDE